MSEQSAISMGSAAGIYRELAWTRMKRGRLLWLCAALLALPVVGTGLLVIFGHWGRTLFDEVAEIHFRFLLPFVPALLASPIVSEELDQKTFTFLFARPAPRSAMVLGKLAAVVGPTLGMAALSVALTWALAMIRFPQDYAETAGHLARAEIATVVGVFAYAGVATLFGSWFTRHPFVAVLGYLLLVEAGLGSAPIVLNLLAMSWHLRNLAQLALPTGSLTLDVPALVSAAVPLVLGSLGLGLACMAVADAEYHGKD
jgi:ABC-type transport system involved in multi-copper enzyme maturation permease subunit